MSLTKETIQEFKLFINGEIIDSSNNKYFESINPSSGEVFARISNATSDDVNKAIDSARNAFDSGIWSKLTIKERGSYLIKIANIIRENAKELADLECLDVGKTIKQTTFIDVPTCADTFEYFGKIESELNTRENHINAPVKSVVEREPVGVVGCIIPWNYPLIMAGWKMAPALIAGNTIIFKPSSKASASIMRLAQIIKESKIPNGVVNIVSTTDHNVTSEIIKSEKVDKISFTGGTSTGQDVIKLSAGNTKKLTMELGGKSPNIVFADCDMDAALGGTLSAIFMNQGQMCTAGSRLLLEDKIYDEFLNKLVKKTKNLKVGPANDYQTDFGPLNNKNQVDKVLCFIKKGKEEGANFVCGGEVPDDKSLRSGFYIKPAIFSDVNNSMTIAQEEIFGPVLCVIKFSNKEEAIKIANDTQYGLASCIWTKDIEKANKVAKELKCGTVWINTYGGFYNEAPFGGYKKSGFGRELGLEGLIEYTQTKHICIDQTPGGKPLVSNWF